MTVPEALHTPAFYLLILASALGASPLSTWIALQVPHYLNVGFSVESAGLIVGAYGLTQAVMRAISGWLGDILGRRRMLMVSFLLIGAGFLIFASVTSERWWLLPFYWVIFGIGHASYVALSQAIVADYFGTLRFATIRGLAQTLSLPAGVALPVVSGAIFDATGSYVLVFVMCGVLAATGSLWLLLIRRPVWNAVQAAQMGAVPEKAVGRA
ncbi:MAG: MFS transporter [Chloroflexi bacterium]|nr:MFS transporter [Chloroflexota bacterium]